MHEHPLVSVVMTSHNYVSFLREAVESVAAQDYSNLELIIVDDASTDGSADLLQELSRALRTRFVRLKVTCLPTNRGKQGALNSVIPTAAGAVTVLFDADDRLASSYVSRTVGELLAAARLDERIAFVYTDSSLIDSNGSHIGFGRSMTFTPEVLETTSYIPECGPTFTEALMAVMPLDETVHVGTKHARWRALARLGYKGRYVPEALFDYRMHQKNLSGIGMRVLATAGRDKERRENWPLATMWPVARRQVHTITGSKP